MPKLTGAFGVKLRMDHVQLYGGKTIDRLLHKRIAEYEPGYAIQWLLQDLGYVQKMLAGIVALEL